MISAFLEMNSSKIKHHQILISQFQIIIRYLPFGDQKTFKLHIRVHIRMLCASNAALCTECQCGHQAVRVALIRKTNTKPS